MRKLKLRTVNSWGSFKGQVGFISGGWGKDTPKQKKQCDQKLEGGRVQVQFDWKLGELWQREGGKFCLIPEGLEGPVRIWQLIGKKM